MLERSKTEQKRELLALVFSNLRLRGKNLEFSLRLPFDLMVGRADHSSWLAFLNTVRTKRFDEILKPYCRRSRELHATHINGHIIQCHDRIIGFGRAPAKRPAVL
jgi:hypothetical protein